MNKTLLLTLVLTAGLLQSTDADAGTKSCDNKVELFIERAISDEPSTDNLNELKDFISICEKAKNEAVFFNIPNKVVTYSSILKKLNDISSLYTTISKREYEKKLNQIASINKDISDASSQLNQQIAQLDMAKAFDLTTIQNLDAQRADIAEKYRQVAELSSEARTQNDIVTSSEKIAQIDSQNSEVSKPDSIEDILIPAYQDTALVYQFYSGFEYNKVSDIGNDNHVRLGLQSYFKAGKTISEMKKCALTKVTEGDCEDGNYSGWWANLPHFFVNIALTGAAESAAATTEQENEQATDDSQEMPSDQEQPTLQMPDTSVQESDLDAVDFELGLFYPIYVGNRNVDNPKDYQELAVGLIATYGGRKIDSIDNFQKRHYIGARFAFNEETYLDIMHGKSEPLKGDRMHIRGQLPVYKFERGRLFLGGEANIEVSRKKKDDNDQLVSEADSVRVYLVWQTSFDQIWKN